MLVALGIVNYGLDEFAAALSAKTFRHWGGDNWKASFHPVVSNPDNLVVWNLTGIDVPKALLAGSSGYDMGHTDWELTQFRLNPAWLTRTSWWCDGAPAEQPWSTDA